MQKPESARWSAGRAQIATRPKSVALSALPGLRELPRGLTPGPAAHTPAVSSFGQATGPAGDTCSGLRHAFRDDWGGGSVTSVAEGFAKGQAWTQRVCRVGVQWGGPKVTRRVRQTTTSFGRCPPAPRD